MVSRKDWKVVAWKSLKSVPSSPMLSRMRNHILKFLRWSSRLRNCKPNWADIVRLEEFEAKKDIPRDQASGPLLTFTWVRTVKMESSREQTLFSSFWKRIRKKQGVSFLSNSWAADLQNVACLGCTSRLEREIL